MNKRTQKQNQKFENLTAAAYDLFEKKDVSTVSIDEIVQKAGVAKGTFYLYFHNKPDLIAKLILKKASEYLKQEGVHPAIVTDADFDSSAKKYLDYITNFLENNLVLTKLIDKNVHLCVRAVLETNDGAFHDLYEKIKAYFEQKGVPAQEVRIKMHLYSEMIVSTCCNAILREQPGKIEEVKPYLYDIILLSKYHITEKSEHTI